MNQPAYTPEPWKFHEQGDANQYAVLTADGKKWVIGLILNGEMLPEQQRATVERMCLAVNYCAGMTSDQLRVDSAEIALEDRDQLLQALKRVFALAERLEHGDEREYGKCRSVEQMWAEGAMPAELVEARDLIANR